MDAFTKKMRRRLQEIRSYIITKIRGSIQIPEEERSDIIDMTSVEKLRDVEGIVSSLDTDTLKLVERALDKIDSGTYGICELCGVDIDRERLEEVPYVRYCVDCQERVEVEEVASRLGMEDLSSQPVVSKILADDGGDVELYEEEEVGAHERMAMSEEVEEGEEEGEGAEYETRQGGEIEIGGEELPEGLEEEVEREIREEEKEFSLATDEEETPYTERILGGGKKEKKVKEKKVKEKKVKEKKVKKIVAKKEKVDEGKRKERRKFRGEEKTKKEKRKEKESGKLRKSKLRKRKK